MDHHNYLRHAYKEKKMFHFGRIEIYIICLSFLYYRLLACAPKNRMHAKGA